MDARSGVIVIDKHEGVTSNDIVMKIRRLFGTKKVGHTGTLDPMATGVLPVLIGRAAKAAEYLLAENKGYVATLKLGIVTDTQDTTGAVLSTCDKLPEPEDVLRVCAGFVGEGTQIPPMYSALKMGGRKLVDLAREGIEVERPARPITIHALEVTPLRPEMGEYTLRVACSKGTYIRTLCHDIGAALGCGGAMASLRRTESGSFALKDAHTVAELEALSEDERYALLLPTEELFRDRTPVTLSDFYARLSRNGAEIYLRKIGLTLPEDTPVSLYDKDGFYAIGQITPYPDGLAIRTEKLFVL
ncbi:MAG: tRNA pseudouridine(55) synthase TruB [Clostridia bacterium]|nr:tRNA pseudouridine(55) synthase TruB [Clostridia bacterium]